METIDQYTERKQQEDTAEHFAGVEHNQYIGTATYSPEDNKIRITAYSRLPKELYERVRAAGFIWAPKQEIFVAPMWTPARHDLAMELCGEIGDEDKSLVERQEERAERFEGYSAKRAKDAHAARENVERISGGIPMGQPILIGHHSERRARKDAERIESGMKRAVNMWETSQYWQSRAAGALAHAKYKDKPTVRARRIKTLGAEMRKYERSKAQSEQGLALWSKEGMTLEQALIIAGSYTYGFSACRVNGEYKSAYDVLKSDEERAASCPSMTVEQVQEAAKRAYPRSIAHQQRWIEHFQNRIAYETAMLQEQGAEKLLEKPKRPTLPPICNYSGTVTMRSRWSNENETMETSPMTSAEYAAIDSNYKGTRLSVDGSHRIRIALLPRKEGRGNSYGPVFLTDSKIHTPPTAPEQTTPKRPPEPIAPAPRPAYVKPEPTAFDFMKDTLKAGVKVVTAPQLFPTPRELAERMAEEADIQAGMDVLEPSAGMGAIIGAIGCVWNQRGGSLTAVEINSELVKHLKREFPLTKVEQGDFLEHSGIYDRILMNPPFENGSDIKHIKHAASLLKPGGKLVAICAGGPRQERELKPMAATWERLPEGTFKEQGTGVNTVLLTIEA